MCCVSKFNDTCVNEWVHEIVCVCVCVPLHMKTRISWRDRIKSGHLILLLLLSSKCLLLVPDKFEITLRRRISFACCAFTCANVLYSKRMSLQLKTTGTHNIAEMWTVFDFILLLFKIAKVHCDDVKAESTHRTCHNMPSNRWAFTLLLTH